jgi:hypothetical protein
MAYPGPFIVTIAFYLQAADRQVFGYKSVSLSTICDIPVTLLDRLLIILSWWQQTTKLRCPDWKITVAGAGIIMKSDAIIEMI